MGTGWPVGAPAIADLANRATKINIAATKAQLKTLPQSLGAAVSDARDDMGKADRVAERMSGPDGAVKTNANS